MAANFCGWAAKASGWKVQARAEVLLLEMEGALRACLSSAARSATAGSVPRTAARLWNAGTDGPGTVRPAGLRINWRIMAPRTWNCDEACSAPFSRWLQGAGLRAVPRPPALVAAFP